MCIVTKNFAHLIFKNKIMINLTGNIFPHSLI